jgi:hypothetical protein
MPKKIITSEAYQIIKQDVEKWLVNKAIFVIPALILFLTAIQQGQDVYTAFNAVWVWVLGAVIDLLRKYAQVRKY